jgi:alpha-beta hydrolase superfamily lysophospholipase
MPQLEPERFQFTSADGLSIACVKWAGQHHVRAVVQIAHGLGEHMGRYAELAETLVHGEFVVYGNDHRGHGLTAKPSGVLATLVPAVLINSSKTWFL